jgi:peptide/nickel transport system permease protein
LALLWLLLLFVLSVSAPLFAPIDPLEQDLLALKQWPSAEHWLGTDALGRDVFSRMVHGVSITIAGVIEAVVMASLLGLSLGVSAGYFGGLWDRCVQQYVSLVQSLPTMLIMLAVLAVFGRACCAA